MFVAAPRACPICRQFSRTVLKKQKFALIEGHPLAYGYDVVVCAACGFVFADTIATPKDYERFYASLGKYANTKAAGFNSSRADVDRHQETAKVVRTHIPRDSAILDVGCSTGVLLAALRESGFVDLCGVDVSPLCVRALQNQFRAEVASIAELPATLGRFDCVVLSHVLEHVSDLHGGIASVSRLLRDQGLLYIEVPDATRFSELPHLPLFEFNPEHINFFSPLSLRNLLEQHGYLRIAGSRKVVKLVGDHSYPAFYELFRKSDVPEAAHFSKDAELRLRMEVFITHLARWVDTVGETLRTNLQQNQEIIGWGTGALANQLLAEKVFQEIRVRALVDSNPGYQGKRMMGLPVLAPTEIKGWHQPILILSVFQAAAIADCIRGQFGYDNTLIFLPTI